MNKQRTKMWLHIRQLGEAIKHSRLRLQVVTQQSKQPPQNWYEYYVLHCMYLQGRQQNEKLTARLNTIMLRRTKDLIKDQLPRKTDNIVFCELRPLQVMAVCGGKGNWLGWGGVR